MNELRALAKATSRLAAPIRLYLALALNSDCFRLGPKSYESDLTVCPIAAAAKLAGVWENQAIATGHPEWGTPEAPSAEVEDFAAWFDICCEEHGLTIALQVIGTALGATSRAVRRAAVFNHGHDRQWTSRASFVRRVPRSAPPPRPAFLEARARTA